MCQLQEAAITHALLTLTQTLLCRPLSRGQVVQNVHPKISELSTEVEMEEGSRSAELIQTSLKL